MNRWMFLTFSLCLSGMLTAQRGIAFDSLNKQLNEEAIPTYFYNGKLYTGTTVDSFDYGQKVYYFEIKEGKIQKHTAWSYDGAKVRDFNYKNGLLHGSVTAYFGNGQKYYEHYYKKGLTEGRQFGWYKDGSPRFISDCMGGVEIYRMDYPKPTKKGF